MIPIWLWILIGLFLVSSIKIVNEYDRGVRFTLGRYTGIMRPGLRFVIPILQNWKRIDIRTKVIDVPKQDTMTKDNVSVVVNAVLYFKVIKADLAVLDVEDFRYATSQLAQTTLRDVIGEATLDQLLTSREAISTRIQQAVDKATDPWGIKVESVEVKDVELPDSLIRIIAKEAEAEREKRSVIIKAEGEMSAAKNLVIAAKELTKIPGGLHIRTLQTVNNLGNENSNTNVYAIPSEILDKLSVKIK